MKEEEMKEMRGMVKEKLHCQMVIHMKACMKMVKDTVMAFTGIVGLYIMFSIKSNYFI
jgi:hypothetical protein